MNDLVPHESFALAEAAYATREERREYIDTVEDRLLADPLRVDLPIEHTLQDGLYTRTMHVPAGAVLTGLVHRRACLTLLDGDISIFTENGAGRLRGPLAFPSPAGIRRLGYAHTATVWTTVHAVPDHFTLDDLDDIEDFLFAYDYLD